MGWRLGVLTVSAMALTLGACNKPAGEKAASAGEAAKPAVATPTTMPNRKPGLWKQTVSTAGMTQATSICLDTATEARMSVWGSQMSKTGCEATSITPIPGGWKFTSTCDMGSGGKTTTTGTVTGDFNSRYKVEAQSSTAGAGAPQMNGEHQMTIDAVWEGPCPAGVKPGDMILPNGMKFNMVDMTAGARPGVRP